MSSEKAHLPPITLNHRELIVVLMSDFDPTISRSVVNKVVEPRWSQSIVPLFEEEISNGRVRSERKRDELARERAHYHVVEGPDEMLDKLAEELRLQPEVAAAYVKPAIRLPDFPTAPDEPFDDAILNGFRAWAGAAPSGIEAIFAHTVAGGTGTGVHVVDLEWNWDFDHEDLKTTPSRHTVLHGVPFNGTNHGTAILGMLSALDNAIGITGICHGATVDTGVFEPVAHTSETITRVTGSLSAGDILLLPYERPGPRFNYSRLERRGGIPLEWWHDDRVAIETAINNDVIVVCAAGNGSEDLDSALYDTPGLPPKQFPPNWTNPFRRAPDSGSIFVGGGAPPPGTHGIDHGPDRSRIQESNFGSVVDAQGWGYEVTTLGYGNVVRRVQTPTKHQFYTKRFGMTSGASAMVAGALASVQGARRAAGKSPFDSFTARAALRATGSPQQWIGSPGRDTIGNRPNLRQLIALP